MGIEVGSAFFFIYVVLFNAIPNELVSTIDAETYFKARHSALTVDRLLEQAGKKPTNGKEQVAQLLAIRWLGEHADAMRKESRVAALLHQVADGQKGADPQGFARAYASRALDRLEGRPVGRSIGAAPADWKQHFGWLPVGFDLVVDYDQHTDSPLRALDDSRLRAAAWASMGQNEREEVIKFVESFGNLRLDRVVLGYRDDPTSPLKQEFIIRLSGAGNRRWLIEALTPLVPGGAQIKQEKTADGTPVTIFQPNNNLGSVIAVIGDTDFLIAAGADGGKSADTLRGIVKNWNKDPPSVLSGPIGKDLNKVSPRSFAIVVGQVPHELRELLQQAAPLAGLPQRVCISLAKGREFVLHFEGTSASAGDAQLFAGGLTALKERAITALQNLPAEMPIKDDTLRQLIKSVEAVKVEQDDAVVRLTFKLSAQLQVTLEKMINELMLKAATAPAGKGH